MRKELVTVNGKTGIRFRKEANTDKKEITLPSHLEHG
jgi:hypothetical protein